MTDRDPSMLDPGTVAPGGTAVSPGGHRPLLARLVAPAIVLAVILSAGAMPVDPRPLLDLAADMTTSAHRTLTDQAEGGPSGSPTAGGAASSTDPGAASGSPAPMPTPSASAIEATPMPIPSPRDPVDYLLISRSDLISLPTSGPAWEGLLAVADAPLGRADLTDQDERHGVNALAAALVYARTGLPAYRERARDAVMSAIGTERRGAHNSILALGRQLGAYVLAADFIRLSGADDEEFRAWLDDIRTRDLGGHGRWTALTATHEDAGNNWGAFAGASRVAASLYLDDGEDVARAAQVLRGFLGDRPAWHAFQPVEGSRDWACRADAYTPVNPPCKRDGIDLDGAIVRDISRGGKLDWPPGDAGIRYTLESLQGLVVQAELLSQNGYDDPWHWSDDAIARVARVVTASGRAGGDTWNRSSVTQHLPWILNAHYGLGLPTERAGAGRVFGYTDWLFGD